MAGVTFDSKLDENGTVKIPQHAVESLGLQPGDQISVRLETGNGIASAETLTQEILHARAAMLIAEASTIVREPGKPLNDPYEAEWARGVEEKAKRMGIKI